MAHRIRVTHLLLAGGLALAGQPALAQEGMLFKNLLEGVVGGRPGDDIEYRQRPPLVVPPNSTLPRPQESASTRNAAWPNDPDVAARRAAPAAILLALALSAGMLLPGVAQAQAPAATPAPDQRPPIPRELFAAGAVTRLAYVVTGDRAVDEMSKAGLAGLNVVLGARTALEPGEAVGVNADRDELAFFPVLYWPIVAGRPIPSSETLRKLEAYMKGGGLVIFDTRDAMSARPGGGTTPEGDQLRRMLQTLDIPELEPIPRDHVLTKTFYILDGFVGRYDSGTTWVEILPPAGADGRRPARAGDNVSPIVITSNDLASAWAVNRRGEPLVPLSGSDPRQREMALRAGVNLVMYALTGNYKADQVHVPALLERLGQ